MNGSKTCSIIIKNNKLYPAIHITKFVFTSYFSLSIVMSSIFLGKVIDLYHTVFFKLLQSFIARTCYITRKPN